MRTKENNHRSPYWTNLTVRRKVDKHKHNMAKITANLGKESTDKEKAKARHLVGLEMKAIKAIDPEHYKELNPDY